jgi:hypothetical protein
MANRTHVDPNLMGTSGLKAQLNVGVGSKPLDDLKTGHRASALGYHRYPRPTPLITTKRSVDDPLLLFEVTLDEGPVSPFHEVRSDLLLQGTKGDLSSSYSHDPRRRLIKPLIDAWSQRWLIAN